MHGGDVINGLHLLPGRSVIEVVNCGFQLAHWEWLEQNALRIDGGSEQSLRELVASVTPTTRKAVVARLLDANADTSRSDTKGHTVP